MTMNTNIALDYLHRGKPLVASIPSQKSGYSAWIGVYFLDVTKESVSQLLRNHGVFISSSGMPVYRIRCFEVDHSLIEKDVWVSERDLSQKSDVFAFGGEDLVEKLRNFNLSIEQLEFVHNTDYPI